MSHHRAGSKPIFAPGGNPCKPMKRHVIAPEPAYRLTRGARCIGLYASDGPARPMLSFRRRRVRLSLCAVRACPLRSDWYGPAGKGWLLARFRFKSGTISVILGDDMSYSVKDIASALGAEAFGAVELVVSKAAEPAAAGPADLALAMTPAYGDALRGGQARAAVVWPGADWQDLGLEAAIIAPRARLALAGLTQMLDAPLLASGVSPHAAVDSSAQIGADVTIGAFAVVGPDVVIGNGTWIADQVSIAEGVQIGANCQIHAGVRLRRGVTLGARVILQPNAAIGGDGFSFVTAEPSHVEKARETLGEAELEIPDDPTWHRIHSLGGVTIGDDVEVGANSSIDAGTIRATRIGAGTKIDSLVQVGHNVIVGEHCLLCAQAGIAGSTVIGDRVVVGGKAGVADNLIVGDDVVLGGGSVVLSNVPKGRVMMGYPATRMQTHIEGYKALRRLPRILRDLAKR